MQKYSLIKINNYGVDMLYISTDFQKLKDMASILFFEEHKEKNITFDADYRVIIEDRDNVKFVISAEEFIYGRWSNSCYGSMYSVAKMDVEIV